MGAPRQRGVTMADVARHAGVSRTTASFVLNDRPSANIPEVTRARVRAAVAELNYRPNAGARALASRKTGIYGLITEIVSTPYAADIIRGVQDRAWAEGKMLLIAAAKDGGGPESAVLETMLEQRVEGLIFATVWHRAVELPPATVEIPTVLVHCFDAAGRLPAVLPDEQAGGYRAVRRLLDAGHTRIAYLSLDPAIRAAIGRRAGYERALTEAGLEIDETLVVAGDGTADDGYAGARQLLDLPNPPTALFCGTDRVAMGAFDAIKERGLRIPQDIAVIGFDNQELIAEYLRPRLTTVALPFEEMGSEGVGLLSSAQEKSGQTLLVDCPLIERASA